MAAGGVSPSSSPRLPSPPPFTEVQIGPKSPTVGESLGSAEQLLAPLAETDDGSTRRIRPGTKAADMASGPPLVPLSQLDSPFQLQEHLKALYHNYTKPDGSRTVVPITRDVAVYLAEPPEGVERSLWLYELCRFLTMKVNNLIIAFFAEDPPCSAQTCPEMRASEWQYLCAVHDPPKSCCAIDYCCHTLDWATNILTSPKYFPSRLTLGSEAAGGPQASMRHLTNIFRRLYRIFAHAWFQHRGVFWQVEGHDGLYVFFKTVCDVYHLIPEDNYTVPSEAEGPGGNTSSTTTASPPREEGRRISILRKETEVLPNLHFEGTEPPPSSISTGATTRRHKHSPSTGSMVTTIAEAIEDNNGVDKAREQLPEVEENTVLELDQAESPAESSADEPGTAAEQTSQQQEEAPSEEEPSSAENQTAESAQPEEPTQDTTTSATQEEESTSNESREPDEETETQTTKQEEPSNHVPETSTPATTPATTTETLTPTVSTEEVNESDDS